MLEAAEEKAKAESRKELLGTGTRTAKALDENKALRERYGKAHKELCRVRDEQNNRENVKSKYKF